MSLPVALIRTDGNSEIGYGHVMRMMALANFIVEDFNIFFLIKNATEWIRNEIRTKHNIIEIPEILTYTEEIGFITDHLPEESSLLILDGYNFNTQYQESIRENTNIKTIAIDDFQQNKYVTDAVINHAGYLRAEQFQLASYTSLYSGPQYALIREEFTIIAAETNRKVEKLETAFVSLGGTDPDLYYLIIDKLYLYGFLRILMVVNNKEGFSNLANHFKNIELYNNLSASEMISLMKQSDLAVLPPSTLSYEYCSVGGGLFVIQTADNQNSIYNFLINSGCALDFNSFNEPTIELVNEQVKSQKKYFNGDNASQLRKIIFQIAFNHCFQLRKAREDDLIQFFDWANDPETRQNSLNKEKISLKSHTEWFLNKIENKNSVLYVLTAKNLLMGTIRFDFTGNSALLSYSLDKKYRGKGLGTVILKLGIEAIKSNYGSINQINGYVHQGNHPSLMSFAKVGFVFNDSPPIRYSNYNYYSLNL